MAPRGIAQPVWDNAKQEARDAMIAAARSPIGTITYGALTRRIVSLAFDPNARIFHELLGEIAAEENAAGRGMLSVVVVPQDEDFLPGTGFFTLAQELGRNIHDPVAFWVAELNLVRQAWGRETDPN